MQKNSIDFEFIHDKKARNAVLLFHGLTGSPFEMKKYGLFLHECGYDVYCYSLPGHGVYTDKIESVTYVDWVNFAQYKYDTLRKKYENFFLSGLCLGAVLSVYLAQRNSDVSGIVSLSATLFLDGWTIPWYNFLMPLALNTITRYFYTFSEREPYGIKNEYVRKNIKMLRCPILLMHARDDDLTSTRSSEFVYMNCSSNIKKYVELQDCYHMLLYDNERKYVFERANAFIQELTRKEQLICC